MDLEHLTKGQIILLTLLVSFMTSIATGIVTVSLMAQMPAPVTQTINRVVERTLERVVEKKIDAQGNTTTKEKTVVVKETDLISRAVQTALPSLVAIYITEPASVAKPVADGSTPTIPASHSPDTEPASAATASALESTTLTQSTGVDSAEAVEGEKVVSRFLARGVYTADGVVTTSAAAIPDTIEGKALNLKVVLLASGVEVSVSQVEKEGGIARLTVAKKSGTPLLRGDPQSLQLGNTVVALSGESRVQVSTGIVSNIDRDDKKRVTGITVDGVTPQVGSVLVSLEGRMLAQYLGGEWKLLQ